MLCVCVCSCTWVDGYASEFWAALPYLHTRQADTPGRQAGRRASKMEGYRRNRAFSYEYATTRITGWGITSTAVKRYSSNANKLVKKVGDVGDCTAAVIKEYTQ